MYDWKVMFKRLSILLLSTLFLSACTLPSFVQKKAGLQISVTDNDQAAVFLDGINVGTTPYKADNLKSGSFALKLVPENKEKQTYETRITLSPGMFTVVTWSFGATLEQSGGEIYELAKISSKNKAEFSIVTSPDNIVVKLDGQSKGFSPLILDDITEGSHTLTLTAPGYVERTSSPNLVKGYRLTVTTKLARETEVAPTPEPSAAPSPSPSAKPKASATPKPSVSPAASSSGSVKATPPPLPYVEIKETGTGWLRVRASADASAEELAKLDVGAMVPYLGETTSGWHKVEYVTGKQGWVSGQYAILHSQ